MSRKKRMSRKRKVVISVVTVVVVAIGALIAAFLLSSPPAIDLSFDVETKEIPQSWVDPTATADAPSVAPSEDTAAELSAEPQAVVPQAAYVSTGKLTLIGDGRPFGEEAYELTISEDRASLHSTGRFWFKVILATVHVTFEQTFEGEGDLRPVMYVAEFHAPLGFDRSIRATVQDDRVTVEQSGDTEEILIEPHKTFTLGTFSTYVLLPRLFALRRDNGSASFEVLLLGGPPNQRNDDDSSEDDLPVMTVERTGTASLRAGDILLEVDCYVVSSDLGESEMFARGDEFLAFRAGDGDESLWVYRSDFFPDGIEIVSVTSLR
jgi:hypothetical protein